MAVMDRKDRLVEKITTGDLVLVADPESGPWWAMVQKVEDGHGVRTFTLAGSGHTMTLGWHQTWVVAA
jgi:hypothetical protein